jgi:hypothetical protein
LLCRHGEGRRQQEARRTAAERRNDEGHGRSGRRETIASTLRVGASPR